MTASSSQSGKLPRAEPWETTLGALGVPRSPAQFFPRQHPPGREKACKPQAWLSPACRETLREAGRAGWARPEIRGALITGAYFPGIQAVMETSAWESSGRRKDCISSKTDFGPHPGVLTTSKGWMEAEAELGESWVAGLG